jgi:2C-methyl-D-erythritol 2,4-cyclodiphosphate synthase
VETRQFSTTITVFIFDAAESGHTGKLAQLNEREKVQWLRNDNKMRPNYSILENLATFLRKSDYRLNQFGTNLQPQMPRIGSHLSATTEKILSELKLRSG